MLIADKNCLERIEEFSRFLSPLIDKTKIAFCEWHPYANSFETAVPSLAQTVNKHDRWRALIITGDDSIHKKNPFDTVGRTWPDKQSFLAEVTIQKSGDDEADYAAYKKALDEKTDEYYNIVRKAKFEAFELAAKQPLTRLVTYLCRPPMVSAGITDAADDPEFNEYQLEHARKQMLREAIINGEKISISLPSELICIAKRTCNNNEYDIPVSWVPHVDHEYSKFGDRNMYFDEMLYFVYDILPRNHRKYRQDFVKFISTVLIIAQNELPKGAVRTHRVYLLKCENDEQALKDMLSYYNGKLSVTIASLERSINELSSTQKTVISDSEANAIFCSGITVPVTMDQSIDTRELYANKKAYGLSQDCPNDEYNTWAGQFEASRRTLRHMLKQPRRAVKVAVSSFKELSVAETEKAMLINEFQLEDLEEHIAAEELSMIETETSDIFDSEGIEKEMHVFDKKVRRKIDTRMKKVTTLLVGFAAIVLLAVGFL
ncbi:MAG: hypothetical protein IKH21_06505, partial [Clostridia bacterium]|nr:hypothetical protein [Clostridia bacterium]